MCGPHTPRLMWTFRVKELSLQWRTSSPVDQSMMLVNRHWNFKGPNKGPVFMKLGPITVWMERDHRQRTWISRRALYNVARVQRMSHLVCNWMYSIHCIGLCEKFMFFANDLSPFIRLWVPISWKLGPCCVPKSFSDGAQASLPGDSPLERLFLYVEGSHLAWEGEGSILAWLSSAGRPVYAVYCTVSLRAPDSINRGKTVTKQPSTADGALIIA